MSAKLPLERLRAVVLTQAWSGALTTQLLANMGAEVIQVEALSRPDVWRGGYPPHNRGQYPNGEPGTRPYDRNALFNAVNTSKLGITLDLNSEEGKSLFLDLVSTSDLLAENYSARVIPNFGLEYPTLRQINPTIIMMRMPSFGASGPYAMYPGNGGTTEPMSGISSLLGYPDGQPMNSGTMHTDAISGMMGFAALLIAIRHRARTGKGQYIDLSQQETATTYITDQILEHTVGGRVPQRMGNRDRRMAPHGFYRCRGEDSWVAIASAFGLRMGKALRGHGSARTGFRCSFRHRRRPSSAYRKARFHRPILDSESRLEENSRGIAGAKNPLVSRDEGIGGPRKPSTQS